MSPTWLSALCPGSFPQSTQAQLPAPEFDQPVFVRQRFRKVPTPAPSVPTAEAFQSFLLGFSSGQSESNPRCGLSLRQAPVKSLCSTNFHESCRNSTAWRLGLVETGQPVQELLAGRGREADRQQNCVRLVSIGNQAKRHVSV